MADKRVFIIDGRTNADPDPTLSVEEVRAFFANLLPELHNCETKETERMSSDVPPVKEKVVTFTKRVGTKG